jgi:hypothetical protein
MKCKQCGHVILVRGKAPAEQKPREEVVGTFSLGAPPASEPVPPASVEQTAPDPVPDLTADLGSVAEVHTPTPTPLPAGLVAASEPSPEPASEPISPDDPFAPRPDGSPEASDPFAGPGPGGYIDLKLDEDEKTPSVGMPLAPPPAAAGPAKTPAPQPARTPSPRAVPPASAFPAARKKGGAGMVVGALAAIGMVGAGAFAVFGGGSTPSSTSPESASPARPQSAPAPVAAPAAAPVAPKPTPAPEPAVAAPQPEPAAEVLPRKDAAPEPSPAAPPSKAAAKAAKPAKAEPKPAAAKRAPPAPARQVAAAPAPPPLPDTIGPRPDQAAVTHALARSQRAIDACVAATLARDPSFDLPATALVIATVNPAGKIVYPTLDDAPLNVSDLGACIKGVVSRTPVQKFEGDVVRVRVPVQLRR